MKRIAYRSLAAISLLAALGAAGPSTRPHYGGTLRIELQAPTPEDAARDEFTSVAPWAFDGLVRLDANGRVESALATSWEQDPSGSHWTFKLRMGVKWHDGSDVAADQVAAALGECAPGARAAAAGDAVELILEPPSNTLPMRLATSPACLVRRPAAAGSAEAPIGTGPFRVSDWQSGRHAILDANDDYWDGRPYLDHLDIQMNRSSRDALLDLELNRGDVVALDPANARRAQQGNKTVWASAPNELLAIRFSTAQASPEERDLRQALSLSLDRGAIQKVLLQNFGESTASLFPSWVSGYAFLFPTQADLAQARKLVNDPRRVAKWKLGYDPRDTLAHVVAERVALNAREAGLEVQVVALTSPSHTGDAVDARLVRCRIEGPTLERAAREATEQLGFPAPRDAQAEAIYEDERAFLDSGVVIPIAYVPELFGLSSRVRNWSPRRWGTLDLSDVWVAASEP